MPDAISDAGDGAVDGPPPGDTAGDAGEDVGEDGGEDVGDDAGEDVGEDAGEDGGPDVGPPECLGDDDCPAGGPCTTPRCDPDARTCGLARVAGCCTHDGDCPADGPCLRGVCDPEDRRCAAERLPGCCVDDDECVPDGPCQAGRCAGDRCHYDPVAGCCDGDDDCDAPDDCHAARCQAGGCLVEREPGCCLADADCQDGGRCVVETRRCDVPVVDWAAIQFPVDPLRTCDGGAPPLVFGRVYVAGRTPGRGRGAGVEAALGLGPDGSDPSNDDGWRWVPGVYNGDLVNAFGDLNDDEYMAAAAAAPVGEWDIAWRFRLDEGAWHYADLVPDGSGDGYAAADALALTVERPCRIDEDGDGATADVDCDDRDDRRSPEQAERCEDRIDNDCDGFVDAEDGDCGGGPDAPEVDFAAIQHPTTPIEVCPGEPLPLVFGRVFEAGITPGVGQGAGVQGELGVGPAGTDPGRDGGWRWTAGAYQGDLANPFGDLNDDEYRALAPTPEVGAWDLAWRFRVGGGPWTFADLPPGGSGDGYAAATALALVVSDDCIIDRDGDGSPEGVDCDDEDARRTPGAAEACRDGVDNDCDGVADAADPEGCEGGEACPDGSVECGGLCVFTGADDAHCGACDSPCDGGTRCVDGACACPDGSRDLLGDPRNCGRCGQVCPSAPGGEPSCLNGACGNPCGAGGAVCEGRCQDLSGDPDNCGACGYSCDEVRWALPEPDGFDNSVFTLRTDGCHRGVCEFGLERSWPPHQFARETSCNATCGVAELDCLHRRVQLERCFVRWDGRPQPLDARGVGCVVYGLFERNGPREVRVLESCASTSALTLSHGGDRLDRMTVECRCQEP